MNQFINPEIFVLPLSIKGAEDFYSQLDYNITALLHHHGSELPDVDFEFFYEAGAE